MSREGEGDSLGCTGAPAQGAASKPRERGRQFRFLEAQPRGHQARQLKRGKDAPNVLSRSVLSVPL